MRPPSDPGTPVDNVMSRIEQTSARLPRALPPIQEVINKEMEVCAEPITEPVIADALKPASSSPLPAIPKQQQSFNKALENITRYFNSKSDMCSNNVLYLLYIVTEQT